MAGSYTKVSDLPQVAPLFPLSGVLLLPRGQLPLNVFEPRYLNMVDDVMGSERCIAVIQTRPGGDRTRPPLAAVGCLGRVTSFAETSDGRYLLTLTGLSRFRLGPELSAPTPYRQARLDYAAFADLEAEEDAPEARPDLLAALRAYLERRGLAVDWEAANAAPVEALVNSLSMALPFEPAEKQALLEATDLQARLDTLRALLRMGAAAGEDDEPPPVQ